MHHCAYTFVGICLNRASADTGFAIFGFSEFLTALALLVLVFSSSDFLYHFRVSVAALPLRTLSFVATVAIGVGTLLTDLWFADQWYAPAWGVSRAVLQGIFGALFLSTVLLWMWFAYMRPPVFSRWNYKHFYLALFRVVVRGSDAQLAIVAGELVRSAAALVRLWDPAVLRQDERRDDASPTIAAYANDAILLLNNRKLCRHVVASSPVTAIVFMEEAAAQKRFSLPLGGFARKVTEEALRNRDSILFHEDSLGADVLGLVQPFSKAMYGNYQLVEGTGPRSDSPLDIDWRLAWDLDGEQFEAYCRITLLTFKDYIAGDHYHRHSYSLYRAFQNIGGAGRDLYKLDELGPAWIESPAERRLRAGVHFIEEAIDFLGTRQNLDFGEIRRREDARHRTNIFDHIAELMFKLVFDATAVTGPPNRAWSVHHNAVWGPLVDFRAQTAAWKVIRSKFFHLLFDEIKRMEKFPNFKGARILGFCLNVLGLSREQRPGTDPNEYALRKAVLNWVSRNYLKLSEAHPPVASACLIGSITLDAENKRLVKTFAQGLSLEPSREYLQL